MQNVPISFLKCLPPFSSSPPVSLGSVCGTDQLLPRGGGGREAGREGGREGGRQGTRERGGRVRGQEGREGGR